VIAAQRQRCSSTQFDATTYLQPSVVLQGRIIRAGVDVKW